MSKIAGVKLGSGPSSKVRAIEPPQGKPRGMITTRRAHLIESGHPVEEPDGMVRLVFVVLVMWVARRRIELNVCFRISSVDQCLLKADFLGIRTFSPVVSVIAERNDCSRGIQFTNAFCQQT